MIVNREAYNTAYERALHGHKRPVWELFLSPFEDTYTRQAREQGERDGEAARQGPVGEPPRAA